MHSGIPGQLAPLSQHESQDLNGLESARVSHANPIITSDETRMPQIVSKSTKAGGAPKLVVRAESVNTSEQMDEVIEEKETPMDTTSKKDKASEDEVV